MKSPVIPGEIHRNARGEFVRDDTALRNALTATLGLVKRVAMMWEMFPEMEGEERRAVADAIYRDVSDLIDDLAEIDARKGQGHA